MAGSHIFGIIVAIFFLLAGLFPIITAVKDILLSMLTKKIKITSKSGATAVLNLKGKNDVDEVIAFADILLGKK
jgi:hypothetical protein